MQNNWNESSVDYHEMQMAIEQLHANGYNNFGGPKINATQLASSQPTGTVPRLNCDGLYKAYVAAFDKFWAAGGMFNRDGSAYIDPKYPTGLMNVFGEEFNKAWYALTRNCDMAPLPAPKLIPENRFIAKPAGPYPSPLPPKGPVMPVIPPKPTPARIFR